MILRTALLAACFALAACSPEEAIKPAPVAMSDEALGHYCQMYIANHPGPKAQVHLAGDPRPLWYGQVSDAVAYLHDPERDGDIVAVYVSDMAAAPSWDEPGRSNWIESDAAFYVTGSRRLGGMGTPEAISFGSESAAQAFAAREGGSVVRLADIPESYVRQIGFTPEPAGTHTSQAGG